MPLNNWMSTVPNHIELRELVMPGSHDAGMYYANSNLELTRASTITQFNDIGKQLRDGTRFFDIRIYSDGGTLRLGHFSSKEQSTKIGAFGPLLHDVLTHLNTFIVANPNEVVILKVSIATAAKAAAITAIVAALGAVLFDNTLYDATLATHTLGSLRGRIIVAFDEDPGQYLVQLHLAVKTTPVVAPGQNYRALQGRAVLFLNGDAPQANKIERVMERQNAARTVQAQTIFAPHLEMFYLTITAGKSNALKPGKTLSIIENTKVQFNANWTLRVPQIAKRSKWSKWVAGIGQLYLARIIEIDTNPLGVGPPTPGQPINIYMYDFVNAEVNKLLINRGLLQLAQKYPNHNIPQIP